jgi:hypothetical protein
MNYNKLKKQIRQIIEEAKQNEVSAYSVMSYDKPTGDFRIKDQETGDNYLGRYKGGGNITWVGDEADCDEDTLMERLDEFDDEDDYEDVEESINSFILENEDIMKTHQLVEDEEDDWGTEDGDFVDSVDDEEAELEDMDIDETEDGEVEPKEEEVNIGNAFKKIEPLVSSRQFLLKTMPILKKMYDTNRDGNAILFYNEKDGMPNHIGTVNLEDSTFASDVGLDNILNGKIDEDVEEELDYSEGTEFVIYNIDESQIKPKYTGTFDGDKFVIISNNNERYETDGVSEVDFIKTLDESGGLVREKTTSDGIELWITDEGEDAINYIINGKDVEEEEISTANMGDYIAPQPMGKVAKRPTIEEEYEEMDDNTAEDIFYTATDYVGNEIYNEEYPEPAPIAIYDQGDGSYLITGRNYDFGRGLSGNRFAILYDPNSNSAEVTTFNRTTPGSEIWSAPDLSSRPK